MIERRIGRRDVLRAGLAGAGALLLAPRRGWGSEPATARSSRLFPDGTTLVESDLHNHTLLSDGEGRADQAFAMMRAAGLQVAALTDHASTNKHGTKIAACTSTCGAATGLDEAGWEAHGRFADAANEPGSFVALRGFEWTTLALGHMNVWFSSAWIDGLTSGGFGSAREAEYVIQQGPLAGMSETTRPVTDGAPSAGSVRGFYDWLAAPVDRPVLGGGQDALVGFNHPNLFGNFENFRFDARLLERMVSLEMFSFAKRDYLYEGLEFGRISPLTQCLDAGWRVGLIGVSDEHGSTYGKVKGRGGLWVSELSRDGVRDAMLARRFFAASGPGMQLDAAANGIRMGRVVPFTAGTLRIDVDLDIVGGAGRRVLIQVLATGSPVPAIVHQVEVEVGAQPIVTMFVDHDVEDGRWLVVRVTDPALPADPRATGAYAAAGAALAYASPFFLDPNV